MKKKIKKSTDTSTVKTPESLLTALKKISTNATLEMGGLYADVISDNDFYNFMDFKSSAFPKDVICSVNTPFVNILGFSLMMTIWNSKNETKLEFYFQMEEEKILTFSLNPYRIVLHALKSAAKQGFMTKDEEQYMFEDCLHASYKYPIDADKTFTELFKEGVKKLQIVFDKAEKKVYNEIKKK